MAIEVKHQMGAAPAAVAAFAGGQGSARAALASSAAAAGASGDRLLEAERARKFQAQQIAEGRTFQTEQAAMEHKRSMERMGYNAQLQGDLAEQAGQRRRDDFEFEYTYKQKAELDRLAEAEAEVMSSPDWTPEEKEEARRKIQEKRLGIGPVQRARRMTPQEEFERGTFTDPSGRIFSKDGKGGYRPLYDPQSGSEERAKAEADRRFKAITEANKLAVDPVTGAFKSEIFNGVMARYGFGPNGESLQPGAPAAGAAPFDPQAFARQQIGVWGQATSDQVQKALGLPGHLQPLAGGADPGFARQAGGAPPGMVMLPQRIDPATGAYYMDIRYGPAPGVAPAQPGIARPGSAQAPGAAQAPVAPSAGYDPRAAARQPYAGGINQAEEARAQAALADFRRTGVRPVVQNHPKDAWIQSARYAADKATREDGSFDKGLYSQIMDALMSRKEAAKKGGHGAPYPEPPPESAPPAPQASEPWLSPQDRAMREVQKVYKATPGPEEARAVREVQKVQDATAGQLREPWLSPQDRAMREVKKVYKATPGPEEARAVREVQKVQDATAGQLRGKRASDVVKEIYSGYGESQVQEQIAELDGQIAGHEEEARRRKAWLEDADARRRAQARATYEAMNKGQKIDPVEMKRFEDEQIKYMVTTGGMGRDIEWEVLQLLGKAEELRGRRAELAKRATPSAKARSNAAAAARAALAARRK